MLSFRANLFTLFLDKWYARGIFILNDKIKHECISKLEYSKTHLLDEGKRVIVIALIHYKVHIGKQNIPSKN